jgi:plasmid stabilization system protein ParE
MIYSIQYSIQAKMDIINVVDYIKYKLFNPMAAKRFYEGLYAKIDSLRLNAPIFAISTYKDILQYDDAARHVGYKGFAIIYSIHGNKVLVHRVIHGSFIKQ